MTEQEYAEIAAACDRLLRAPGTSLERVAIPMLHVVNEHPAWIGQYEPVLRAPGVADPGRLTRQLTDSARAAARAGRALARSLRRPLERATGAAASRLDMLIVSRLGHPSQLDREDDLYFGPLQQLLHERGATSELVLVDHTPPGKPETAARAGRARSYPRRVLPRSVSPRAEATIWRGCVAAWRRLRDTANRAGSELDKAVARLACRQALSSATTANLRLHASLGDICRRLQPHVVVTTYEGSASERMIWHAARSEGRRPLCVGYQHARLLQHAHAIRRAVQAPGVDCDPDVILTLGEIPHQVLADSPGLRCVPLIAYGSHRYSGALPLAPVAERPAACLVLPDANEREAVVLFEFALLCAQQTPTLEFVLRPHPNVDFGDLSSRHGWLRNLPPNVTVSRDRSLEQDCSRARYCLYRGSSAAMSAVIGGVKPFYLARQGELPFDPLFALADWREVVTTPAELVERARAADCVGRSDAAQRAARFCERYTSRLRPEAIDELLALAAAASSSVRSASTDSIG